MSERSAIRLLLCLYACAPLRLAAAPHGEAPSAPTAASRAAIAALDACVRRLDPELDVGLGRIEPLCPGLVAVLESSGAAATLPDDWKRSRSELSASSLRALRRSLAERAPPPARRVPPDTRVLRALLDEDGAANAAERGAWARFTRWLRSLVEGLDPGRESRDPLWRFGDLTLPQRVWTILGYAAVGALLAFVAWVVRAELRAAGLLGGVPVIVGGAVAAAGPSFDAAQGSLSEVAPLERPGWLLRRLAATLQQLGRLPPPGHLTPREVARAAQLDAVADREPLQAIAAAAERVRFGAAPPAMHELEPAIEAAAALLQRLGAGARPASTAAGDPG